MGTQPEMPSKAGRRGLRPFSQDTKKTQKIAVVHRVPVPPGPLYLLPAPQGHKPGRLSRIPGWLLGTLGGAIALVLAGDGAGGSAHPGPGRRADADDRDVRPAI